MKHDDDVIAQLRAVEAARCEALMHSDIAALSSLLRDDLAHVHLNGSVDNKPSYLTGVREKFRFISVKRGTLKIRVYGATAVMIGELIQRTRNLSEQSDHDVFAVTTQVWVHEAEGGKLSTCHNAVPI